MLRASISAGATATATSRRRSERAGRSSRGSCCRSKGTTSRRAASALAARAAASATSECLGTFSSSPIGGIRSLLGGTELGSLRKTTATTATSLPRPLSPSSARRSATAPAAVSARNGSFRPSLGLAAAAARRRATMATTTTAAAAAPSSAAPSSAPSSAATSSAPTSSSPWDGSGTQEDLMLRDQVILVSEDDAVLGGASKYDAHRFEEANERTPKSKPNGLLHRAFSVFLFDSRDRLLLQQRAACKITFPSVWTNTCCSHQLHGQVPPEVDDEDKAASGGEAPGAAAAAVRKLWHELGVRPGSVPPDAFKLVARLHYCAPDDDNEEPWGEHELDYVLLARVPDDPSLPAFSVEPNPEEVGATRWVTREELQDMMREEGLKWSPWFRIIVERWLLREWWKDGDSLERLLRSSGEERARGVREVHRVVCGRGGGVGGFGVGG